MALLPAGFVTLGILLAGAWIDTAGKIGVLAGAGLLLGVWWLQERRNERLREDSIAIQRLSEDVIGAATPSAMAEQLSLILPQSTRATSVKLYLFQRRTRSLERLPTTASPGVLSVAIDSPPEGLANAAVLCFRNHTLLHLPDLRKSSLVRTPSPSGLPRSAIFVPLVSQHEVLGVLEASTERRSFGPQDQAALEHIANQAATSLKLHEQRLMREQVFHSEKLAATGQLISGVASDLRAPIETISRLAHTLAAGRGQGSESEFQLLETVAQRAAEIVARLVSFAGTQDDAPRSVDVNALLSGLVKFREPEWRALGLRAQSSVISEPAVVLGTRGQIEQVFLNLLVHSEKSAAQAPPKAIAIQSRLIAGRVHVEIRSSAKFDDDAEANPLLLDPLEGGLGAGGLSVCQSIVRGHGGEIRFRSESGSSCFEVDLPLVESSISGSAQTQGPLAPLTAMLVDSDLAVQRQLLTELGSRGHRVVPVAAAESAETAQRFHFDVVFWAMRPGGTSWSEAQERILTHVPSFVLVTDGYDAEFARSLDQTGGFLLSRPIQDAELERILREIQTRVAV